MRRSSSLCRGGRLGELVAGLRWDLEAEQGSRGAERVPDRETPTLAAGVARTHAPVEELLGDGIGQALVRPVEHDLDAVVAGHGRSLHARCVPCEVNPRWR